MKITGYRIQSYVMKMDRPIGDANSPMGEDLMPASILWIETDLGINGIAPCAGDVGSLFDIIEGQDPREVVGLWRRMVDATHKGGLGLVSEAVSAIDIALWDLKAKIAEEPLWRMWGAREGRAKAYASCIGYCLTEDELFDFYRRMAERGVDGGKLKIGLDLKADLRRIEIMREALSVACERPKLMLDVNEYWSPKQAIRLLGVIERDFDIMWIEEPARRWDSEGLRFVSSNVKAAVATGENLKTIGEVSPLIREEAVDILNISAMQSGFTGCRQIANFAHAYELPVSMMNCQANFMAHLAAVLPNHLAMEVVDPGREHCLQHSSIVDEGFILLNEDPGLGLSIDDGVLDILISNPPERESNFPFPRREGAGLYVKGLAPGEVVWNEPKP